MKKNYKLWLTILSVLFLFDTNAQELFLGKKGLKQVLDSTEKFEYDSSTKTYESKSKFYFTYNTDGKIISFTEMFYNKFLSIWQYSNKFNYEYYSNGLRKINEVFRWNQQNNIWEADNKLEIIYDSVGNPIEEIFSNGLSNQWIYSMKNILIYETSNKLNTIFTSKWDSQNNVWDTIHEKKEYFYDGNGNLSLLVSSTNIFNNQWIDLYKREYINDVAGNPTSITFSNWNLDSSKWSNSYKSFRTYNASNRQILDEQYSWDTNIQNWKKANKNLKSYDTNNNFINEVYFYYRVYIMQYVLFIYFSAI